MVRKTANIQDVARVAGVSTATVSRALSHPDLLTEATRKHVLEAIRATGYRANQAARNLRKRQARAILVLVPNLGNPFFSQILSGLSERFAGSAHSVLIMDTNHLLETQSALVDFFLDSRIDGMISLDGGLPSEQLNALRDNGFANRVINACEWTPGFETPSVRSDNETGIQLAIRHLHERGHQRIAHVTGPAGNVLADTRRRSFIQQLNELNLPFRREWMVQGDFSLRAGQEAASHLLDLPRPDWPTAIVCASDEIAIGMIAQMHAMGISVPRDMSVIGFDDIETAEFCQPPLTTIRQNRILLGQIAADLMLQRLEGTVAGKFETDNLIEVELVIRSSTADLNA